MTPLFSIETAVFTLVWSRRRGKPVPVTPEHAGPPFGLVVQRQGYGAEPTVRIHQDQEHGEGAPLFEETDYTLFVQSRAGAALHIRHQDPVLIRGLQRSQDSRVVHGTINFGAQVGQSRFVVEADGVPQVAFVVEVFPSKLDYRSDYEALRDDVREIAAELVLECLRATYQPGRALPAEVSGTVGWVLLLKEVVGDLEQALEYIARRPHQGIRHSVATHRIDRLRRPDATLRRAVQRGAGSGAWCVMDGGLRVHERMPGGAGQYTLDTPEHRWLAARLALIRTRLADLQAGVAPRRIGLRQRHLREELGALQQRLARLAHHPMIQEVQGEAPEEPPWRLLSASGYREAYQACLRLQQGLSLEGGPLHLRLKELHLLYEYWCFLTLVRLAAEATGQRAPLQSLIAVEQSGLRLRLRKGRRQTILFPLAGRRRLEVTYNPRFGGAGYLVPQQPDLLLTLRNAQGTAAQYVLDAKYRLDATPSYGRRYGTPGPPAEALNDLHRYRDAIRDRRGGGRAVVQALALFPYREATPGTFARSRLYRMLDEIGVGALPLLPGATTPLRDWLDRVLAEAPGTSREGTKGDG